VLVLPGQGGLQCRAQQLPALRVEGAGQIRRQLAPQSVEVRQPEQQRTGVAALQAKLAKAAEPAPMVTDTATGELLPPEAVWTYAEVNDAIQKALQAKDTDALLVAVDLIRAVPDEHQRAELDVEARAAWKAIKKAA